MSSAKGENVPAAADSSAGSANMPDPTTALRLMTIAPASPIARGGFLSYPIVQSPDWNAPRGEARPPPTNVKGNRFSVLPRGRRLVEDRLHHRDLTAPRHEIEHGADHQQSGEQGEGTLWCLNDREDREARADQHDRPLVPGQVTIMVLARPAHQHGKAGDNHQCHRLSAEGGYRGEESECTAKQHERDNR